MVFLIDNGTLKHLYEEQRGLGLEVNQVLLVAPHDKETHQVGKHISDLAHVLNHAKVASQVRK